MEENPIPQDEGTKKETAPPTDKVAMLLAAVGVKEDMLKKYAEGKVAADNLTENMRDFFYGELKSKPESSKTIFKEVNEKAREEHAKEVIKALRTTVGISNEELEESSADIEKALQLVGEKLKTGDKTVDEVRMANINLTNRLNQVEGEIIPKLKREKELAVETERANSVVKQIITKHKINEAFPEWEDFLAYKIQKEGARFGMNNANHLVLKNIQDDTYYRDPVKKETVDAEERLLKIFEAHLRKGDDRKAPSPLPNNRGKDAGNNAQKEVKIHPNALRAQQLHANKAKV